MRINILITSINTIKQSFTVQVQKCNNKMLKNTIVFTRGVKGHRSHGSVQWREKQNKNAEGNFFYYACLRL